jgi:FkbM family methyltransferase
MSEYKSNLTKNDKFVNYIFGNNHKGYYIEAGACNGIIDSNTYYFDKKQKWNGILVEPSNLYNELCVNRPTAKCFNCCIGDANKETEFTEFINGGYNQLSCTSDCLEKLKDVYLYNKAINESNTIKKQIQIRTLDSILDEVNAPNVIEYLSLDVEGSEVAVIDGIDFTKRKILVISAEGMWSNSKLETLGYKNVINPYDKSNDENLVTWLSKDQVHPWDCWWIAPELIDQKKDLFTPLLYKTYDWDKKEYIKIG